MCQYETLPEYVVTNLMSGLTGYNYLAVLPGGAVTTGKGLVNKNSAPLPSWKPPKMVSIYLMDIVGFYLSN